jgi:nitrate/nitrite-specific signal transduction histidine kinase
MDSEVVAWAGLVTSAGSVIVAVLKARDWVEAVALAALRSGAGRAAVSEVVQDRQSRAEDKMDALAKSLESVADRLETRIEALATRMDSRLDRLDKDTHAIDVRLSVIESTSK